MGFITMKNHHSGEDVWFTFFQASKSCKSKQTGAFKRTEGVVVIQ